MFGFGNCFVSDRLEFNITVSVRREVIYDNMQDGGLPSSFRLRTGAARYLSVARSWGVVTLRYQAEVIRKPIDGVAQPSDGFAIEWDVYIVQALTDEL